MVPNALLRWTILASAMVANRLEPILELFIGWRAEARVVPMECAKRHIGEVVWNRTGQLVGVEVQIPQAPEVAQFGRNRTGQRVYPEVQIPQAPEVAQFGRNRTGQRVEDEVQRPQAPEVAQFGRNRTGQRVGSRGTAPAGSRGCPVRPESNRSAELPLRCRNRRLPRLPSSAGIEPVSWLPRRYRNPPQLDSEGQTCRLPRLPSSAGIEPVSELE